ncbi:hypothetical protein C1N81_44695 [Streptomyces sp. SGAir0957]
MWRGAVVHGEIDHHDNLDLRQRLFLCVPQDDRLREADGEARRFQEHFAGADADDDGRHVQGRVLDRFGPQPLDTHVVQVQPAVQVSQILL